MPIKQNQGSDDKQKSKKKQNLPFTRYYDTFANER